MSAIILESALSRGSLRTMTFHSWIVLLRLPQHSRLWLFGDHATHSIGPSGLRNDRKTLDFWFVPSTHSYTRCFWDSKQQEHADSPAPRIHAARHPSRMRAARSRRSRLATPTPETVHRVKIPAPKRRSCASAGSPCTRRAPAPAAPESSSAPPFPRRSVRAAASRSAILVIQQHEPIDRPIVTVPGALLRV